MEKHLIEDLASKIGSLLPPAPSALKKEIEESIRQAIRSSVTRLDLVTRDEFEIQSAVLQRTRMKLEQLEKKVAELEQADKK
ncbi:MAG: accessory factor UbiK family protein [Pseudomonadota bacterium]